MKGDDPSNYDKRRLCHNCKTSDEPEATTMTGQVRWQLWHHSGENGTPKSLDGLEFELAAESCTPILQIHNKAEKHYAFSKPMF
jgi:hypothetical protein